MAGRRFVAVLVSTVAGPLIWAAHFLIMYGFTALACTRGLADSEFAGINVVPLVIVIATIVAALATVAALVRFRCPAEPHPPERKTTTWHFLRWIGAAAAGLSLVAILWEGVTATIVPACA